MAIAAGDLILIQFRGLIYGQRTLTNYGFRCMSSNSVSSDRTDQALIASHISTDTGTQLMGTYLAVVSPALTVQSINVQKLWPFRVRRTELAVALSGTNGTGPDTANVSAVITRKTDLGGRNQISNLHLPGVPLTDMATNGEWDATMKTALGLHAVESYDTITVTDGGKTITLAGCIIQAPYGTGAHQMITAHTVNPYVRVQRRRTVGLGE